jgi:hypothetical protein
MGRRGNAGILMVAGLLAAAEVSARTAVDRADLERLAAIAPAPLAVRLGGVLDAAGGRPLELDLDEFRVALPDARLVVHGAGGRVTEQALPAVRYLRGPVVGEPGARAVVAVGGGVAPRGLVFRPDGVARLVRDGTRGFLLSAPVRNGPAAQGFRCETADGPPAAAPEELVAARKPERPAGEGSTYAARVALETDHEYFLLFGDAAVAATYALDLIGYLSTIYAAETDTDLLVPYLSLWTTPDDPWVATGSSQALQEFRSYWIANRTGVSRTIAHQLSGRDSGGGIAYVGALCSSSSGYGYTGSLGGSFDPQNPQTVWDSMAVAHEIGHNFNSPHTHCYNGLGGEADPIDGCYNTSGGCYAGTLGLPGVGTVIGGSTDDHPATIMSYCHLRPGNYANVTLTFGLDHVYGVAASRAPERMAAHVVSRATANPACLAQPATDLIFADGVESGGPWRWSGWEL